MSKVDRRHSTFITEMIDHGDEVKAYQTAYPKCTNPDTARVNSSRLLRNATIASKIEEGMKQKEAIIREAKKKELEAAAKDKILSVTEVDAIVCDIMRGNLLQEKKKVVYNPRNQRFETVTIHEPPDATQRIAAADKFYKRHGHYAPIKKQKVEKKEILVPGEDDL